MSGNKPYKAPDFKEALQQLNQGKIVIYPTETLYGMGVDAQNEAAIAHLFQVKKRNLSQPVPVLLPSKKEIQKYCPVISEQAQLLMDAFWPGPLTIVLKSDAFPKGVSQNGTVGFRVSGHPLVQNLLLKFNKCITATSANISNKESPEDPMEFFKIFPKDSFLLIMDIKRSRAMPPSTVIDCTGENYKILRESAISKEEIDEVLNG